MIELVKRENEFFVTYFVDENVFSKFTLVSDIDNEESEKENILSNIIDSVSYDVLEILEDGTNQTEVITSVKNHVSSSGVNKIEEIDVNVLISQNQNNNVNVKVF